MRKIVFAYLFLLIDLVLVVNMDYFSLAVPLVAAMFLVQGFGDVANENENFEQCVIYAHGLAFARLILFMISQFGWLMKEAFYLKLATLFILLLFLGMTHGMLRAFHEIEQENNLFAASLFCMIGEVCLFVIGLGCIFVNDNSMMNTHFSLFSMVGSGLFFLALYQLQVVYLRFEKVM